MRTGELAGLDDMELAGYCNTEGWPDEPEAWIKVLAYVWGFEMIIYKAEHASQSC